MTAHMRRRTGHLFWFRQRHVWGLNLNTSERMKNIRVWRNFCYLHMRVLFGLNTNGTAAYLLPCDTEFRFSDCSGVHLEESQQNKYIVLYIRIIFFWHAWKTYAQKYLAYTCHMPGYQQNDSGEFHITQTPMGYRYKRVNKIPRQQPLSLVLAELALEFVCWLLELRKEFPPTHLKTNKLFPTMHRTKDDFSCFRPRGNDKKSLRACMLWSHAWVCII